MKRLVEFTPDDRSTIRAESEGPDSTGGPVIRGGSPVDVVEKAQMGFEAATERRFMAR
jgi:hypothetical protein